jgi:phosphoribosylglycinamide formyltransferase-1
MADEFIGDPLKPAGAAFDPDRMAAGEPGVPSRFTWRGEPVEVTAVVRSWKETGPCTHGSGERYVNKHWYELATDRGTMRVYFERKARGGAGGARWWLFSLRSATAVTPGERPA